MYGIARTAAEPHAYAILTRPSQPVVLRSSGFEPSAKLLS